jgi:hypothetical protein
LSAAEISAAADVTPRAARDDAGIRRSDMNRKLFWAVLAIGVRSRRLLIGIAVFGLYGDRMKAWTHSHHHHAHPTPA